MKKYTYDLHQFLHLSRKAERVLSETYVYISLQFILNIIFRGIEKFYFSTVLKVPFLVVVKFNSIACKK